MLKTKFKCPPVDFKKVPAKSRAIPKQSMDLKEIVRRFVKRIPVDVNVQPAVYLDGLGDQDLEKVARLDATDRAFHAMEVAQRAEALKKEAEAKTRELVNEDKRIADEKKAEAEERERATSIDYLDNTMLDDTKPRKGRGGKDSKSGN